MSGTGTRFIVRVPQCSGTVAELLKIIPEGVVSYVRHFCDQVHGQSKLTAYRHIRYTLDAGSRLCSSPARSRGPKSHQRAGVGRS